MKVFHQTLYYIAILSAFFTMCPAYGAPYWVPDDKADDFDGMVKECRKLAENANSCAALYRATRTAIKCEADGKSVTVTTKKGNLIEDEVREYDLDVKECRIDGGGVQVYFEEPPPEQGFFSRLWSKTKEYGVILIIGVGIGIAL